MKNKWLLIFSLSLLFFTSCVSLRPGKNIDKAEDRIIKYQTGITNQLERFPTLADTANTIVVLDSVKVGGDTTELNLDLVTEAQADSLSAIEESFDMLSRDFYAVDDSFEKLLEEKSFNEVKLRATQKMVRDYKAQADSLFGKYVEASKLNNQFGKIEDGPFVTDWKLVDGKLTTRTRTKEEYEVYEKSRTTLDIDIRKEFWQDKKFWLIFLPILLVLLFFFGKFIQEGLQSVVATILKLIRKVFSFGI